MRRWVKGEWYAKIPLKHFHEKQDSLLKAKFLRDLRKTCGKYLKVRLTFCKSREQKYHSKSRFLCESRNTIWKETEAHLKGETLENFDLVRE